MNPAILRRINLLTTSHVKFSQIKGSALHVLLNLEYCVYWSQNLQRTKNGNPLKYLEFDWC